MSETETPAGGTPLLTVVIPAYNEEARLPAALDALLPFLKSQSYPAEVVIVDNASRDRTWEIACAAAARDPRVRALQEPTRGKGAAVRTGMLAARGEYRIFCDADFSMPVEQLDRFVPEALGEYDVAIASREVPGARRYGEPVRRHLVGRVFNTFVRWVLLPGLQDTQCGFKCFRARAAEDVFRRVAHAGFSFDVEALVIARRRGYRIVEVPIDWYFDPHTSVRVLRDSIPMALDVLSVRWKSWRGEYDAD